MARACRSLILGVVWTFGAPLASAQSTSNADAEASSADAHTNLDEVVVTARKRSETLTDIPISITAFTEQSLDRLNIRSFDDYATQTPNLSFSYGTGELSFGGTRTPAIRGVAGEGTVGVYIDDTPVPDTIDPRVVDIARIEILKGPQGTLFGQGSLGGNLRIITAEPSPTDPAIHFQARMGTTSGGGSPDYGFDFAGSQNLIDDVLTARIVGFVDHTAGFITRWYPQADGTRASDNNQGAQFSYGGSLTLLWRPIEQLSVTARIMYQMTEDYGWPAPFAPLPAFEVTSLTMNRAANVQEGSSDHWTLPSISIDYKGPGFTVVSSTSYFDRDILNTEDASEGTQWAFVNFGLLNVPATTPFPWNESLPERSETNETRISFDPWHGLSGIAGVYISQQFSNEVDNGNYTPGVAAAGLTSPPGYCGGSASCPTANTNLDWFSTYPLNKLDEAAFGELYYEWRHLDFTLGLRYFKERQSETSVDAGALDEAYIANNLGTATEHGLSPKAAIAYKFDPNNMLYASAAKGFRSGGVGQALIPECGGILTQLGLEPYEPTRYKPDTVWNYEVGGKSQLEDGRLTLTGALFQMNWSDIQQRFTVPVCFLGITENEGAARLRGGEFELSGRPLDFLEVRGGIGYVDSRVTEQGLAILPPVGSRIAQVPEATENFSATITQPLTAEFVGFITGDVNHTASSISNTASLGYPLTRAGYTLVNGSVGVRFKKSELSLYAANITNQHPNLGDINPAGYVAHTSLAADAPIDPRVVTLQPFNAGIQYRQRF
jgi:outer membrane receptor protein involved in Fe transport